MSIDWFTFVAQIVNFLILVALLRKFLYGPILRAMESREKRVTRRLEEAQEREEKAEHQEREYREKSREIDTRREELLKEAREEAEEERDRLMRDARKEVDRKREEWRTSLDREQADIVAEVSRLAGDMSIEAARRVLEHLADADLESRMFSAFASRLSDLDGEDREQLRARLSEPETTVSVRSAFDAGDESREQVRATLRDGFDYDGEIAFVADPDLICGLELDADGRTYGWNVAHFLRELDDEFEQRLQASRHGMLDGAQSENDGTDETDSQPPESGTEKPSAETEPRA